MTTIDFDFGDYFSLTGTVATPLLGAAEALTDVTNQDCTLNLTWSKAGGLGDWSKLFAFKTDSTDLANVADATDIVMDISTVQLKWASSVNLFDVRASNPHATGTSNDTTDYGASLVAATGDVRKAGPAGSVGNNLPAGHTTIAKDYVRQMAHDIFAREGAADLFSNEAEMVSEASALYGTTAGFAKAIMDKFKTSAVTQVNGNPLWVIMSGLLNIVDSGDKAARFTAGTFANNYKVAAGEKFHFNTTAVDTGVNQYYYMPLIVGDTMSFIVTFNTVTAITHGIGANDCAAVKYKIKLTLAN